MELIQRSEDLQKRFVAEDDEIGRLKSKVRTLEKEKRKMIKDLEAANSSIQSLEESSAAKDEELKERAAQVAAAEEKVSQSREEVSKALADKEQAATELKKSQLEHFDLMSANTALRSELEKKTKTIEERDLAMKALEEKAAKDLEAQFEDFVGQAEKALNINFLEGWEAAMQRLNIDAASAVFRDVPWPDPDGEIPPFSFEKAEEAQKDGESAAGADQNVQE